MSFGDCCFFSNWVNEKFQEFARHTEFLSPEVFIVKSTECSTGSA